MQLQTLDYTESVERINNPDQGFYRPIYVRMNDGGASYNKNIVNKTTRLYHLRVDISAFSGAVNGQSDKSISISALDGLTELLTYLKTNDKNAIVRFAYDPSYGGAKDKEPAIENILGHIAQFCPILNGYKNTVTAIEAGLIGPWGEMHSSKIAKPEYITRIVECLLSNTQEIPVLVRTPKMIYDYLGITRAEAENYTIPQTSKAYRLGLFNDGYLGSSTDLGTYTDREKEIPFLSGQTSHLPYGGEVVIPNSKLHDIDACLPEMYEINLSYLNVEWNNQVIDKWKNSNYTENCGSDKIYYGKTAFEYIENHMGYRFVLTRSELGFKGSEICAELKFKNVGFGNLNRIKRAKLIFTDESGEVAYEQDAGSFTGSEEASFSVKNNLTEGKYDVYLRVYGEEAEGAPLYCLQFANDGLWNAELKANKIGSIEYSV